MCICIVCVFIFGGVLKIKWIYTLKWESLEWVIGYNNVGDYEVCGYHVWFDGNNVLNVKWIMYVCVCGCWRIHNHMYI